MTKINRSTYQKAIEENKRLLADININCIVVCKGIKKEICLPIVKIMECKCKLTPLSVLFIWCNGEPWSVGEIDEYMQEAIADENYELAGDCKREIERRQALE